MSSAAQKKYIIEVEKVLQKHLADLEKMTLESAETLSRQIDEKDAMLTEKFRNIIVEAADISLAAAKTEMLLHFEDLLAKNKVQTTLLVNNLLDTLRAEGRGGAGDGDSSEDPRFTFAKEGADLQHLGNATSEIAEACAPAIKALEEARGK